MIIKDCKKCKKDYMYDPNMNPEYRDICQDCHEQGKLSEQKRKASQV